MPKSIINLLHRRSDLSTFLVHLTRAHDGRSARENLIAILNDQTLEARSVFGMGRSLAEQDEIFARTQRTVSFTETPLEHVWMMCEEIENRRLQFGPYGLAFTKTWARRRGVNPVWYVDITAGHSWLTEPINELLTLAEHGHAMRWDSERGETQPLTADTSQVARIAPFIEQMGNPSRTKKEFWWEREWRYVGDLVFNWFDLVGVFVPQADHAPFLTDLTEARRSGRIPLASDPATMSMLHFLDPTWGLERMIAELAGVKADSAGPFPS